MKTHKNIPATAILYNRPFILHLHLQYKHDSCMKRIMWTSVFLIMDIMHCDSPAGQQLTQQSSTAYIKPASFPKRSFLVHSSTVNILLCSSWVQMMNLIIWNLPNTYMHLIILIYVELQWIFLCSAPGNKWNLLTFL